LCGAKNDYVIASKDKNAAYSQQIGNARIVIEIRKAESRKLNQRGRLLSGLLYFSPSFPLSLGNPSLALSAYWPAL
jgi:hypothetical protein